MKLTAVKFVDGADDVIEGPGMPFGGPANGNDLYGEHFSKSTDFAFEWFPTDGGRPLLYHHSLDNDVGLTPVGRVKGYEVKADIGVWTKAQLDKSSEYFDAIKEMVKAGKLFFSSGAMAHLVEVEKKSGEIKRWPWVELSLTPTPANLFATVEFAEAARHYKSAGLELPTGLRIIRQEDGKWVLYSHDGEKKLGTFDTEEEAKKREQEIQFFKDQHSKAVSMAMMRQMATDAGADMSDADMQAMLDAHPDADEEMMRKLIEKKAAKSAPLSTPVASRGQGLSIHLRDVNVDAFWSHVDKGAGDNAHWLWTGAKNTKGYGILEVDGETVRAHRVSYEMKHGPIPDGKDVGHKTECATTSCVRPSHLELVTNQENADERAGRETAKSAPALRAVSWEDVRNECQGMLDQRMSQANMMMPTGMSSYCYIEETYSDHVICCVCQNGQERHYSVPFELGDSGHVESMGQPTEVEETYTPVEAKGPAASMPMMMHADMTKAFAASLVERTKDLRDRRLKEGRVISGMNRKKLQQCLDAMGGAMTELQALLDSTAPQPAKAAAVRRQADYLRLWAATLPAQD